MVRQTEQPGSITCAHPQSAAAKDPYCTSSRESGAPVFLFGLLTLVGTFGRTPSAFESARVSVDRRLVPVLTGSTRLCPLDGRKHGDFLSISMKADSEKPSPSEWWNRDRASAVFTYTYRLR